MGGIDRRRELEKPSVLLDRKALGSWWLALVRGVYRYHQALRPLRLLRREDLVSQPDRIPVPLGTDARRRRRDRRRPLWPRRLARVGAGVALQLERVVPLGVDAGSRGAVGVKRASAGFRVTPVPGPAQPAEPRVRLVSYLELEFRAAALAVGVVEPVAGPLGTRLEVRRVGATRDVYDRPLRPGKDVDLTPVPSLRDLVLGIDGVVGFFVGEVDLDHLPVPLVQPSVDEGTDEVVVVVEVEEPVLEPHVGVPIAHHVAVDAVGVALLRMQRPRLVRVLLRGIADAVGLRGRASVRIAVSEERQR